MHKTIITTIITALLLISCKSDKPKYWISTYPIFYTGSTITEIGDSICFKYLPEPSDSFCSNYEKNDSIFDANNDLIGIRYKNIITIFDDETKIHYVPFEPRSLNISLDSLKNTLINNKWFIEQGGYSYRLDFFDRFESDTIGPYPYIRHKLDENDSLRMPYNKWLTIWFLEPFADSYILGLSYIGASYFQLFKVTGIVSSKILLESINEYNNYLTEGDTNKISGQIYNLEMIPTLDSTSFAKARSFFTGHLIVKNHVSDSISLTSRSRRFKINCNTADIKEIFLDNDSLEVKYTSGYLRKHSYKLDEWGDNIILNDGTSIYDYLKYNLSDSTLIFYDRLPLCNTKNRAFKVVETILRIEK